MELHVIIQGLPLLRYVPPLSPTDWAASRETPCRAGLLCRTARAAGGCCLQAAVLPVIEAFSSVVSYEQVLLVAREGRETAVLEETGQQAAFRLLLLAIRGAGCPFFARALPAGAGLPWGEDNAGTFRRMVRRLAFARRAEATAACLPDWSLAGCERDIEAHLDPILGEARRRRRQDAAVNAVILLYNCSRLAVEETRERLASRATAA